ncbi:EamA family transporter [Enterobacter kobei]|uniref:EamA family transporter n=1 Tax=Enterobacter kobei TaxID=208224 RepID=UPI001EE21E85|nr:EamA family transporter [Enterobacter kobei]
MVTRSLITFLPGAHNSDREDPLSYRPTRTHLQYYEYHCLTKKWLITLAPWLFVFLWSQGLSQPNLPCSTARRFIFLFLRGAFSCLVLLLLTLGFRARFPSGRGMVRNLIVGLFLQSFFLGGCFYAIHRGMPSGIVALITGLQPVLTAILVSLMHRQSLHPRKWLGIAIGFAGVFPGALAGPA